MRTVATSPNKPQAEPQVNAWIRDPRRTSNRIRVPDDARYETYMQELAADSQRLISLGTDGGA